MAAKVQQRKAGAKRSKVKTAPTRRQKSEGDQGQPYRVEIWALDRIIPYEANARRIPHAAIEKVAKSLQSFGWQQPIVVNEKGVILAGHTRLLAAQHLGLKNAPVHVASGLAPAEVRAYRLMDNRSHQESEWDYELLKPELLELGGLDFDLSLTGFDLDEIQKLLPDMLGGLTDEDAVPAIPEDPTTALGDLWLLGRHRLLCGDSTSLDAVQRLMDGEKADMVFTDPPYGIDEETDREFASRTRIAKGGKFSKIIGDTSTQTAADAHALCAGLGIRVQIFWGANHYAHTVPESASWLVWDKRCEDKQRDMNSDAELAWVSAGTKSVRVFRHLWKGLIKASEHGEKRVNPVQKPVALAEWCFNEYDPNGKSVLDLFGGSGSTLIACEKTGRNAWLMELDRKYCDVIVQRWQDYTGQMAVLDGDGRTFAEIKSERFLVKLGAQDAIKNEALTA